MVTLLVEGGRQDKLRAGDLLGAVTGELAVAGAAVGKIDVGPSRSYVSIAAARWPQSSKPSSETGAKSK
jgi:ATP-independent RNA helicase DbpA